VNRWLAIIIAAVVVLCGCATVRDRAVAAMNGTATFADSAHDELKRVYKEALDACLELSDTKPKALACANDTDRRFDQAWSAYRAIRTSWLILSAVIHTADLSGARPDEAELLKMLAELAGVVSEFRAALLKVIP
jgi:hypothetical protein